MSKQLEDYVREVDYYTLNNHYEPSEFALMFLAFIKLVNGVEGEENESPVIHMDMLDQVTQEYENLFVAFRGSAKTSVLHEYMILYIAVYGEIPGFGEISVGMYISDTIDNGVKSMFKNLKFRYYNSEFLQRYLPEEGCNLISDRWEFTNLEGHRTCFRGFGASTGVRGFKEYGTRPVWLGMDDLMSDKNAESPTIIEDITKIVYKAARQALHPGKRMIIWTGTPFNKKDPLYVAAGSANWNTRTYPICENFPCEEEDFVGAWDDRFNYDFVKGEYESLLASGQIAAFNQELMLKIVSDEDRLILDEDVLWYSRSEILKNKSLFNFYITTDFATSEKQSADYSAISVWAHNANGDWFWVDGILKRQLMDKNVDDLFRLAQTYKPQQTGIEVSGQQGGFIPWVKKEMLTRKIWFTLASSNNSNKEGIRPLNSKNKVERFNVVVPWFKAKKMYFPEDMRDSAIVKEIMEELSLATMEGFKSRYDDALDTISQLAELRVWKPSETVELTYNEADDVYHHDIDDNPVSAMQSYIV